MFSLGLVKLGLILGDSDSGDGSCGVVRPNYPGLPRHLKDSG